MRKVLLLLALFIISILQYAQVKKQVPVSKVSKVTVFLEGSQVERMAKATLTPGKQEIVFSNISPNIEKQSIQVRAEGNVTVLSVNHQQNFLKEQQKQDEIKEIEDKKEQILFSITKEKNLLQVYKQEESMMIKNQGIGGSNGIKAPDLKEAVDFQRLRLTEIYQKQQEIEKEIKKMELEIGKINRQLIELNQKADLSTSEIVVTVQVEEATSSNFTVTYLVKNSGWYPTYDIRVKDISAPINLQFKANVFQNSGEDWKDVKLFLSTGNPKEKSDKPSIDPWYLRYKVYAAPIIIRGASSFAPGATYGLNNSVISGRIVNEKGQPIASASVIVKGTQTGTIADENGNFRLNVTTPTNTIIVSSVGFESKEFIASRNDVVNVSLRESEKQLSEVVVTGYGANSSYNYDLDDNYKKEENKRKRDQTAIETITTYQPTTVIYEIKDPYTILNDGKTYTVDIDGFEIPALYEYYAIPKLEPDVYLTAKIIGWQELNLQPGDVNLFFEGTYLGQSFLDVLNAGDTLKLSLGKDKGVIAKRTLLKEYSSKKFLGNNKTDIRQYEIVVRNNKQQAVNIIIEDQFPISTQKDIEVQDKKYDGAKLNDDNQKLTWTLSLEPKKESKLNFRYEVKYPKEKTLNLD
jgi:hypothetical protein